MYDDVFKMIKINKKRGIEEVEFSTLSDLERSVIYYRNLLLGKIHNMFLFEGLPDTIDKRWFINTLFINGTVGITKSKGKIVAVRGGYGCEPNIYDLGTKYVWANIEDSANSIVDKDIIVFDNNNVYTGVGEMIMRNAELLAHADISTKVGIINTRATKLLSATSDNQKNQLISAMTDILNGKLAAIVDNTMFDEGVKATDILDKTTTTNELEIVVRIRENILANFYQEFGIPVNSKFKKAQVNSDELTGAESASKVNISDMLECREKAVKKCNELFGTNITVTLNPLWETEETEEDTEDEKYQTEDMTEEDSEDITEKDGE